MEQVKKTFGDAREQAPSKEALDELRKKVIELRFEARARGADPRDVREAPTFAEFSEVFLKERAKDHADGWKGARRALGRATKSFGHKLLGDIMIDDIKAHYREVAREVGRPGAASKGAAARKDLAMLSALFTLAQRKRLMTGSPTRHVKRLPDRPRDVALTSEERDRFGAALERH